MNSLSDCFVARQAFTWELAGEIDLHRTAPQSPRPSPACLVNLKVTCRNRSEINDTLNNSWQGVLISILTNTSILRETYYGGSGSVCVCTAAYVYVYVHVHVYAYLSQSTGTSITDITKQQQCLQMYLANLQSCLDTERAASYGY